MKKALLIGGFALAALLVVVAGVYFGPQLYYRVLYGPSTELGYIRGVERVDQGFAERRPKAGYQFWVVHFVEGPRSKQDARGGQIYYYPVVLLLDSTGQKHHALAMQEGWDQEHSFWVEALLFELPEGRQPQSVQFNFGPPVQLPPALGK